MQRRTFLATKVEGGGDFGGGPMTLKRQK